MLSLSERSHISTCSPKSCAPVSQKRPTMWSWRSVFWLLALSLNDLSFDKDVICLFSVSATSKYRRAGAGVLFLLNNLKTAQSYFVSCVCLKQVDHHMMSWLFLVSFSQKAWLLRYQNIQQRKECPSSV